MSSPRRPSFRLLRPGARAACVVGLVGAALAMTACARDSYLVVQLKATSATFTGVTKVVVEVHDSAVKTLMATRVFTITSDAGVSIDAMDGKTFSLSFTPDRSGTFDVQVAISNATGCIGSGSHDAVPINKGGTASTIVTLLPGTSCTPTDAGVTTPDAGQTFAGCAPADPMSCASGKTCIVDCANRQGVCVGGGTKGPGEACGSNSDCMPGTQCFDFACPGTSTKYCLKFCNADVDCAGSTTVSSTSKCSDPVVCPPLTTYKTCGFVCDPRGNGTVGCPVGLTCLLFQSATGAEDSPACGCAAATRTHGDGDKCPNGSSDCAPGFLCDQMPDGMFCRRICQMGSAVDCPSPQACVALQNNATYGVCL